MKKLLASLLVGTSLAVSNLVVNTPAAAFYHDPAVLLSMEQDPSHYYFGQGLGTGAGTYIDVNTIAVDLYNPPEYIISYDTIQTRYPGYPNIKLTERVRTRIYYNYDKQEAYYEWTNRDNQLEWNYITPDTPHSMDNVADMVFSIAYNMHFYKNPRYRSGYLEGNGKNAYDFVTWKYDNTGREHQSFK